MTILLCAYAALAVSTAKVCYDNTSGGIYASTFAGLV